MSEKPITDAEAQQLLSGATPEGHPELSALAASIADVRRNAAQVPAPQPSFALAAQLEHPTPEVNRTRRSESKRATSVSRFGLAAKIAAAVAALAVGFVGIGAAGALPGAAQDAFDDVVSTIVSSSIDTTEDGAAGDEEVGDGTVGDEGTTEECVIDDGAIDEDVIDEGAIDEGAIDEGAADEGADADTQTDACEPAMPVGSGEFSDWVKQGARDPNKIGSEFGAAVSEQARELKNEKAEERAADAENNGTPAGTSAGNANGTTNGNAGPNGTGNGTSNGIGHGNTDVVPHDDDESSTETGKPADPPGGRP